MKRVMPRNLFIFIIKMAPVGVLYEHVETTYPGWGLMAAIALILVWIYKWAILRLIKLLIFIVFSKIRGKFFAKKYKIDFSRVSTGNDFEDYVAASLSNQKEFTDVHTSRMMKKYGMLPEELQRSSGDGGVDVVAFKKTKGGLFSRSKKQLHVIQCKFYTDSNTVGSEPINKLYGACRFFAKKYQDYEIIPVFITTSSYTQDAIKQSYGVSLFDGSNLRSYLKN